MAEAVALVDGSARVLYANRAAGQLFNKEGGLRLDEQKMLSVGADEEQTMFLQALGQRVSPNPLSTRDSVQRHFPIRTLGCYPYVLRLLATQERPAHGHEGTTSLVWLFISDLHEDSGDRTELVRQSLGISPAEADVVVQLSKGRQLKEIARLRGVTYETVRSQLRSILHKTGARRQADVVRLAARFFNA